MNVCLNIGKSNEDYYFFFTWSEVKHIFKNNESLISFTLDLCVGPFKGPRKCSVESGGIWTSDTINVNIIKITL